MEWKIFNRHPRASEIAEGLGIIPANLALTPVREKRPYRSNWQHEEPVSREAIATAITLGQKLISKKGKPYTGYDSGYGVRLGEISGGLLAIDVDGASAEPILKAICPNLPKSVSWTSGKPGRYQIAFQIPPEYREKLANFTRAVVREWEGLKTDTDELLEFRYNYCQSVLPPSYHPTTGRYSWVNSPADTEIAIAPQPILDVLLQLADKEAKATIEAEEKKAERERYLEQRKLERQAHPSLSTADSLADILELDILPRLSTEDIYDWGGHNFKRHGKKLVGFCPQHGGSSGTAFQVNPADNSWYCHSCQEGGHAVQYRHFANGGHGTPKGKDFTEIVKELADDAGVELPEWKPPQQTQQNKTIPKLEWWQKCGLPREANNLAKFVRWRFGKIAWRFFKRTGELPAKPQLNKNPQEQKLATQIIAEHTTAITLWTPLLKLGTPYINYTGPGSIPTYSEYQKLLETENWLIKEPNIKFDLRVWGDTPAREAIAKGWNLILDKHGCGEGKSHVYGALRADKLEGIERTVFAATNHRNPTVESVEHRKDLIAKHNGLTYDNTKHTPLGNPYQTATPKGQTPDIKPPCVEHKLFNTAYELQLNAFSGKGSKVCKTCPLLASGCDYLEERRNTLGTEKVKDEDDNVIGEVLNYPDIRADLNGLNKFDVPTALIIDEIDQTLEPSKPIHITKDAIARGNMKLASLENQKLAKVLQEICQEIYALIDNYEPANKHGSDHFQVMEKLASLSIPKNEWLSSEKKYQQYLTYIAKDKFNCLIEKIYGPEIVDHKIDLWGEPEYTYKANHDPITREITTVEEKPTGEILPTIPSLDNLIAECQKLLKTNFDEIIDSGMTPGEKTEALELNHTLDFLSPILKAINGYRKVSLSLNKNCLTITKPWYRHQDIIKSAAVVTFLDTTQDVADLRRNLNLDKDEPILVFSSPEKDHSNLTLKFITDFGHASNQRRSGSQYTETERIAAFINQIVENHKSEKIGLIDYKAHAYSHKLPDNIVKVGHWGNDSRGSNQFLDCTTMIAIGDYTENLGALAAKWQCMTGQIVTPSKLTGDYGRHVKRRRIADLEQVIGRPRATNRPDEQIVIYLPGKWTSDEISAITSRLPGVNIEKVDTYDVCPQAAQKGEQVNRKIINTMWELAKVGQNFTQEKVAQIVGLSRSRVSQVCLDLLPTSFVRFKKMLVLLWNTLNRTNNPKKALSELPEEIRWFVSEWLPDFPYFVQQGETLEEMAENIEFAVKTYGQYILEYVSVDTIIDLIKLFMAPMPISFWEELRTQVEPIPILIEN
ncbi:bifunctional DNA primase/polymerase [Okeania sp. SIO1I7]|uniref:bifunctional DNA primase/polymerase n=1 Tax=Okeania sp. SIO1I7 TaxID=2607772 RepID=UPI0013F9A04A|nr:bifunctional DNA primase/polymerase [Okeania sp. SIO1I7]NET30333.1 hypothetical protein [Okeania sp. SIO1I7]